LSLYLWSQELREVEKVGAQKTRRKEIEMYWEERKLHWKVRMTSILGKLKKAKVTSILGQYF
jgi:hypothetical protein